MELYKILVTLVIAITAAATVCDAVDCYVCTSKYYSKEKSRAKDKCNPDNVAEGSQKSAKSKSKSANYAVTIATGCDYCTYVTNYYTGSDNYYLYTRGCARSNAQSCEDYETDTVTRSGYDQTNKCCSSDLCNDGSASGSAPLRYGLLTVLVSILRL